ncbi:hypothetical protein F4804DRAFT_332840 [Jackrogersella minutella]|nr:hypothetical protein F4804DRAFT_332840 [Jackrogersella minutella]
MASRHSQYRQHGGSSEHLPLRNESTLAYDSSRGRREAPMANSASYQGMDRTLRRVPKFENKDTIMSRSFGHWLGRHKAKRAASPERLRISEPQPLLLPQAPTRPKRPPFELTPQSGHGSRILPELEAPKSQPKVAGIQRQHLGRANEALGSHPVASWLGTMEKKVPPRQVLLQPADSNGSLRIPVSEANRSHKSPVESESSNEIKAKKMAEIKAERRKGRVFLNTEVPKNLYEFPDPETWQSEDEQETDDGDSRFWEDAGFDDVYEPKTEDSHIPNITITKPSDDGNEPTHNERPQNLLSVDHCYKALLQNQKREIRGLNNALRYLLPLAWLISEAEGIDPDDAIALEDALKRILADRKKLFDLFPLARILAEDQKVDVNDFKTLPRALRNVLYDRDNAKKVAEYHKMVSKRLEGRLAHLRGEENDDEDDEEYIRL